MTMAARTRDSSSVRLIADPESQIAAGVAAELAEHNFDVDRARLGESVGYADVIVVVVEQASAIDVLRGGLDWSVPTLALAATRKLAADIMPHLGARHDLATAGDTAEMLMWRLQRLVRLSRSSVLAQDQFDALTGLLNRRTFERVVGQAVTASLQEQAIGVLYLDLDRFKSVNDRLGHEAGDRVLRDLAALMTRSLLPADLASRLGGDEFGILLIREDTDTIFRDSAQLLQDITRLDIPDLRRADPSLLPITASGGLTYAYAGATPSKLLNEASMATYEAKNAGRNQLAVYDQMVEAAKASSRDLSLQHFESLTRVATERLVEMIKLKSRRLVDTAKEEANYCSTTGLYSRHYFNGQFPREIDVACSQGRALSLALIDVDHFHDINMGYGWPTGDRVLRTIATVAQANIRATDWVARYGGEEFVIVMPDTALDRARQVAERVRQVFASTITEGVDGQAVAATVSIGVAQRVDGALTPDGFVNQASNALLLAKNTGRNRVEVTGPS